MPLLDVSNVLADPDVADTFDVIRSAQTVVDGYGVDQAATAETVVGVVAPKMTTALDRLADGQQQHGKITIYTTYPLQSGAGGNDADIVVWPSGGTVKYVVVDTDDFSQFGAGFIVAECNQLALNP